MIDKPKKERRFLKALGRVGEILIQEVLIKIGSNLIKKIGGKKTLPSILFLFLSLSLFAQYPATGNKQRLGFQTTADGLTWRGSLSDTATIQPTSNQNAWVILDTINLKIYSFDFTSNAWNALPQGHDTTSLSNRINLKLNISDTASMLAPYFKDADTTSLNLTSRFATKLNISDTASMLTNYLRTGVAASTYLTQSNAASTYLPLTGGTLTGTINRQEGNHNGSASTFYYNILNYFAKQDNIKYNPTAQITFTDRPGTLTFENVVRTSDIHLMTAKSFNGISLGQYLDTTLSVVANQDGGRIGISKLNPAYKLDVNGTFNASGNSLIGGTLGITGATTLTGGINGNIKTNGTASSTATPDNIWLGNSYSNGTTRDKLKIYLYNNDTEKYGFTVGSVSDIQYHSNGTHDFYIANTKKFSISNTNTTTDNIFTVNNSAVFNEGSADADFRVESVGNANMVFVDASTDRIGIGTNSPTKTLDVNGEVRINTVTATPTSLLGKDGSNVVGEVTSVNQSGLMKAGGTTTNTSSVGIITVAHGLSYTPTQVLVTLAQQNSYVIVCHGINSNNLLFTVYDSVTGNALNNVSVGFFWLAIK